MDNRRAKLLLFKDQLLDVQDLRSKAHTSQILPHMGSDIIIQVPLITDNIIQYHLLQIADADSINSWLRFPKQDRIANVQDLM
jgi:hypothetical protein